MLTLVDFRKRYAEAFDLSAGSWRNFQSELAPVLGMRARPTDDRVHIDVSPGFTISPAATPEDCGLLTAAGILKGSQPTIRQRTLLRWHAGVIGGTCPVTQGRTVHEAMTTLLLLPEVAEQLDHIEMTREFAVVLLAWRDGRQSVFETRDAHDLAKRFEIMANGRLITVAQLGGKVIHDMALWLGAEPEVVSQRAAMIETSR